MIRFEDVTRHYGDADSPALREVSIEFNRGDFVFLIGASGSGKSTLLRMILRESLPQRGRVTVAGQNLGLMLERRVPEYRRSIGMVFQDFRLLPDKTVYDNVAFAMRVIGAPRPAIRKQVMKILSRVKLDHLAKRYPHEISGGEQQRAAIARAIVNSPAIVLADEPTGNLDPRASEEVMKILRWINASGTTVIMATHDRAIVDRMSRRVVQLHRGRLVRDEPAGLYDPAEGSEAWKMLAAEEAATGLRTSDPMPLRTQAHHIVPAASPTQPGNAQPAGTESAAPGSREGRMKVNHYRVTWPEDDDTDSQDSADSTSEVDAADLPEFDQVTGETAEPEPEWGETPDPVLTLPPAQAPAPKPEPRLNWLSHADDPAPPRAESPATESPAAESPAGQPAAEEPAAAAAEPPATAAPEPNPVPRPRASAAEATYTDSQRTAEQLKSSKGGLFRRKRRK